MGMSVRDAAVKLDEMCARTIDRWDEDYQQLLKDGGKQFQEQEERKEAEKAARK